MQKLNLTITLNTQRKDKNGCCAVRIRSTINRKQVYHPCGFNILPEHFDLQKKEVIKHPNKSLLNSVIRNKISEIERKYLEQGITGNSSPELKSTKTVYFNEYALQHIKKREKSESKGTIKHKLSYLKKFNEFKSKVRIVDCDAKLLVNYENYCRSIGNVDNTIWSSLKFVKTIVNDAYNEGKITVNPIRGFKNTRYVSPEREYLTEMEINQIEDFIVKSPIYINEANWFLFSCYCGLRFGDLVNFNKSKIVNDKIILRTAKSKTDVSIKIHPKLKIVIERLGANLTTNEDYNRKLKVIGIACGINKPLTSHIARHSFAVLFLTLGGSIEVLSKLLGHTSIKTTQIYGKIINQRIDNEIDMVFGK